MVEEWNKISSHKLINIVRKSMRLAKCKGINHGTRNESGNEKDPRDPPTTFTHKRFLWNNDFSNKQNANILILLIYNIFIYTVLMLLIANLNDVSS